eukprot:3263829-Prymnesium_polylepis.1
MLVFAAAAAQQRSFDTLPRRDSNPGPRAPATRSGRPLVTAATCEPKPESCICHRALFCWQCCAAATHESLHVPHAVSRATHVLAAPAPAPAPPAPAAATAAAATAAAAAQQQQLQAQQPESGSLTAARRLTVAPAATHLPVTPPGGSNRTARHPLGDSPPGATPARPAEIEPTLRAAQIQSGTVPMCCAWSAKPPSGGLDALVTCFAHGGTCAVGSGAHLPPWLRASASNPGGSGQHGCLSQATRTYYDACTGLPWRALGWWSNGELTGRSGRVCFTARDRGVASVGWCWARHGTWLCPCLQLGLVERGSWGVRAPCQRCEV